MINHRILKLQNVSRMKTHPLLFILFDLDAIKHGTNWQVVLSLFYNKLHLNRKPREASVQLQSSQHLANTNW